MERYLRLDHEGELRAKSPPGRPASISTEVYGALAEQVAEHNDASLKEHCELWREAGDERTRTLRWAFHQRVRHVPSHEAVGARGKKSSAASEQDPEARAA